MARDHQAVLERLLQGEPAVAVGVVLDLLERLSRVLPRRSPGGGQPRQPGTRTYLSAGLPGADWWVAGAVGHKVEDADVELDEVERLECRAVDWQRPTGAAGTVLRHHL